MLPFIHLIFQADRKAPKKLRQTARRIFKRLKAECGHRGIKTVIDNASAKRTLYFLPQ